MSDKPPVQEARIERLAREFDNFEDLQIPPAACAELYKLLPTMTAGELDRWLEQHRTSRLLPVEP